MGTKIIKAKFDYANLNVKVSFVNSDGNFSRYNSDSKILTIGDGENVQLKFEIEEAMANGSIKSISWLPNNSNDNSISIGEISSGNGYEIKQISHNEDYMEYQYRILSAVKPSWTTLWKDDLYLVGRNDEDWGTVAWLYLKSKTLNTSSWSDYIIAIKSNKSNNNYKFENPCSVVPNPDEVGKIYPEEEFKKIVWYYKPKRSVIYDDCNLVMNEGVWNCEATREPVSNTKVIENSSLGKIVVIINHNGSEQNKIEIPVYLEKRACGKENSN